MHMPQISVSEFRESEALTSAYFHLFSTMHSLLTYNRQVSSHRGFLDKRNQQNHASNLRVRDRVHLSISSDSRQTCVTIDIITIHNAPTRSCIVLDFAIKQRT